MRPGALLGDLEKLLGLLGKPLGLQGQLQGPEDAHEGVLDLVEEEAEEPGRLVLGPEKGELPLPQGQDLPEGAQEEGQGLPHLPARGPLALPVEGHPPSSRSFSPRTGPLGQNLPPVDEPHGVAGEEVRQEGQVRGRSLEHRL
jgi:hypothetical protein